MSASNASGSMTPWTSLARRAGEAKGPDRELDGDVWGLAGGSYRGNMAYTASVDAVLALVREKLPDWRVAEMRELIQMRGGKLKTAGWSADLQEVNGKGYADGDAPTAPLALLRAFCLAMAAKAGEREPA